MISPLCAIGLLSMQCPAAGTTVATYNFAVGKALSYEMSVGLDGYLPLLGGQEGTADLKLGVSVTGLETDGNPRAVSELSSMKVFFNGAELPFGLANIKALFPKTTVSMSPQGKVLKSDAPDGELPVKLPGLDIKRFPDISYLPLEFPVEGIEEGKEWTFKRAFNGSDITYRATPKSIKDNLAEIDVKIDQIYVQYEDENKSPVQKPENAFAKITTTLSGTGTVKFDLSRGLAKEVLVQATANSKVEETKSGKSSGRLLKTTLKVKLL